MKKLILGDYDTLMGTSKKPSKIEWLMQNDVENIEGVQIISLASDMLPKNILTYHEKLLALVEKFPFLKRISVALLCWPLVTTKEENVNIDVAASTLLPADLYFYAAGICRALQKVYNQTCIQVDISYHPMLTWPTCDLENIDNLLWLQDFLWNCEIRRRWEFFEMRERLGFDDVGINIENEPVTSDPWGNLTHSGNRLFSEQNFFSEDHPKLPPGWGVTADLQHCGMILLCLTLELPLAFPPFKVSGYRYPSFWPWEAQFRCLQSVIGDITFHVAQVEDPLRHITPPIRWDDPIMPWPLILRLMRELDEERDGKVWYAVEIDGGHLYPEGYQHDLEAFLHLQETFGK